MFRREHRILLFFAHIPLPTESNAKGHSILALFLLKRYQSTHSFSFRKGKFAAHPKKVPLTSRCQSDCFAAPAAPERWCDEGRALALSSGSHSAGFAPRSIGILGITMPKKGNPQVSLRPKRTSTVSFRNSQTSVRIRLANPEQLCYTHCIFSRKRGHPPWNTF